MESVLNLSLKDAVAAAVNQKLILQGVDWDFYEQILKEYEGSNALHFAYDDGFLEVELPLARHEVPNRILQDLVATICVAKRLRVRNVGSTTLRKALKTKGCEPDTAFYIQNAKQIQEGEEIDLSKNPPPDLVIEVDITSPSLNKMPIYAAMGVPEVWLYRGEKVVFYKLFGGFYEETSESVALPLLSSQEATDFLKKGLREEYADWIEEIREWAKLR